jgi:hypothetical protein
METESEEQSVQEKSSFIPAAIAIVAYFAFEAKAIVREIFRDKTRGDEDDIWGGD